MSNVRNDTHRAVVLDDGCAEEGGSIPPGHWRENQGRPIPKAPRVPRKRRSVVGPVTVIACSVVAILLWVHFGVAPR